MTEGPLRVVIVGAGFAGLNAAKALRQEPVHVTIVDRRNFHLFQPLTYQVATGALSPGEIAYPLRAIFKRYRNVRVLMAEVADFDLEARELHLRPVFVAEWEPVEEIFDGGQPGAAKVAGPARADAFQELEWRREVVRPG